MIICIIRKYFTVSVLFMLKIYLTNDNHDEYRETWTDIIYLSYQFVYIALSYLIYKNMKSWVGKNNLIFCSGYNEPSFQIYKSGTLQTQHPLYSTVKFSVLWHDNSPLRRLSWLSITWGHVSYMCTTANSVWNGYTNEQFLIHRLVQNCL